MRAMWLPGRVWLARARVARRALALFVAARPVSFRPACADAMMALQMSTWSISRKVPFQCAANQHMSKQRNLAAQPFVVGQGPDGTKGAGIACGRPPHIICPGFQSKLMNSTSSGSLVVRFVFIPRGDRAGSQKHGLDFGIKSGPLSMTITVGTHCACLHIHQILLPRACSHPPEHGALAWMCV